MSKTHLSVDTISITPARVSELPQFAISHWHANAVAENAAKFADTAEQAGFEKKDVSISLQGGLFNNPKVVAEVLQNRGMPITSFDLPYEDTIQGWMGYMLNFPEFSLLEKVAFSALQSWKVPLFGYQREILLRQAQKSASNQRVILRCCSEMVTETALHEQIQRAGLAPDQYLLAVEINPKHSIPGYLELLDRLRQQGLPVGISFDGGHNGKSDPHGIEGSERRFLELLTKHGKQEQLCMVELNPSSTTGSHVLPSENVVDYKFTLQQWKSWNDQGLNSHTVNAVYEGNPRHFEHVITPEGGLLSFLRNLND